jgi:hypothetical protein
MWGGILGRVLNGFLKFSLLMGLQGARNSILDAENIATGAWNTGDSFHYRVVFVRTTEEKSRVSPSSGVVDRLHRSPFEVRLESLLACTY